MEQTQYWSELFERTAVGYATAYDQLSEQVKPDLYALLSYFKAYHNYNGFDERGLEAKLEALQHEPTALEKTMTEVELYKVNSPLWAKDLTASQKCITGFPTVSSMSQTVVKVKMRRHDRQLHRATFSKGHVRKAASLPTTVFGFQLYDIVLFNNHRYYIKGRRSSGSFALVSVEGLKDEERMYKKLILLAHTNAYLMNHYVNW